MRGVRKEVAAAMFLKTVSGNSRYEFHSRGLREEVSDVYYDVWVSGVTISGVHSTMQFYEALEEEK